MPSHESPETLVVLTTLRDGDQARTLVRRLVEARLVACGNVVPGVESIYRWDGAVQEDAEVLVLLKTRPERWEALREAIAAFHPYDVPELLALPVAGGLGPYLAWIATQTQSEDVA